ncbi:MAG: alpha/beta fold hydrolase [Planctomycetaceae bacterium]
MLHIGLAPFGSRAASFHRQCATPGRLAEGLIIILPGIEGCSTINDSIARGLVAGALPHAVKIIDWRKYRPWNPLHLAMLRHNQAQAAGIADFICKYQRDYPRRPVHLIGHSAGAGMALFVLRRLPPTHCVGAVILLAPAVSRQFDILPLLTRTRRGIWNFYSPLDLPTVGFGTLIFGTMDRRHTISAGALGFRPVQAGSSEAEHQSSTGPQLRQIRFRTEMIRSWNFGGHFGSTNAVFVQRHVAPICTKS